MHEVRVQPVDAQVCFLSILTMATNTVPVEKRRNLAFKASPIISLQSAAVASQTKKNCDCCYNFEHVPDTPLQAVC